MMTKKSLFFLTAIVLLSGILPAFAEVTDLQLDRKSYLKGDSINVKGTVSVDTSGLVTIVLRDPNDNFVLLSQASIQSDDSFEKIIPVNEKFQVTGMYNATAFVLNMTAAKTQSFNLVTVITEENFDSVKDGPQSIVEFEYSLKEDSKLLNTELNSNPEVTDPPNQGELTVAKSQQQLADTTPKIADFVDTAKDPQYYFDRYDNEPSYKLWFERNYPNLTMEEAVGYTEQKITQIQPAYDDVRPGIIPQAEAISVGPSLANSKDNRDIVQIGLAVVGLTILFGVVYRIKKKVDVNHKGISIHIGIIRKKIITPMVDSNPIENIRTRFTKRVEENKKNDQPQLVYCPHCGSSMWEKHAFCRKCGNSPFE